MDWPWPICVRHGHCFPYPQQRIMTDLSPAAQAVLDAYANRAMRDLHGRWVESAIAAALRAAALYCTRERRILMTIAAELEGQ
jgi:hypothetical protein